MNDKKMKRHKSATSSANKFLPKDQSSDSSSQTNSNGILVSYATDSSSEDEDYNTGAGKRMMKKNCSVSKNSSSISSSYVRDAVMVDSFSVGDFSVKNRKIVTKKEKEDSFLKNKPNSRDLVAAIQMIPSRGKKSKEKDQTEMKTKSKSPSKITEKKPSQSKEPKVKQTCTQLKVGKGEHLMIIKMNGDEETPEPLDIQKEKQITFGNEEHDIASKRMNKKRNKEDKQKRLSEIDIQMDLIKEICEEKIKEILGGAKRVEEKGKKEKYSDNERTPKKDSNKSSFSPDFKSELEVSQVIDKHHRKIRESNTKPPMYKKLITDKNFKSSELIQSQEQSELFELSAKIDELESKLESFSKINETIRNVDRSGVEREIMEQNEKMERLLEQVKIISKEKQRLTNILQSKKVCKDNKMNEEVELLRNKILSQEILIKEMFEDNEKLMNIISLRDKVREEQRSNTTSNKRIKFKDPAIVKDFSKKKKYENKENADKQDKAYSQIAVDPFSSLKIASPNFKQGTSVVFPNSPMQKVSSPSKQNVAPSCPQKTINSSLSSQESNSLKLNYFSKNEEKTYVRFTDEDEKSFVQMAPNPNKALKIKAIEVSDKSLSNCTSSERGSDVSKSGVRGTLSANNTYSKNHNSVETFEDNAPSSFNAIVKKFLKVNKSNIPNGESIIEGESMLNNTQDMMKVMVMYIDSIVQENKKLQKTVEQNNQQGEYWKKKFESAVQFTENMKSKRLKDSVVETPNCWCV